MYVVRVQRGLAVMVPRGRNTGPPIKPTRPFYGTLERGPLFSSLVKKRRCGRPKKVPGAWNLRDV